MNSLPSAVASVFDSKVGFEASVFFVTWAGITFLAIIAMHLHLRVLRLERAAATVAETRPYGRFIGARLDDLLGGVSFEPPPRLVVAVSATCRTCERVLGELASAEWTTPTVVLWTEHLPPAMPAFSSSVVAPSNGPALATKLGILVTPFGLWIDEQGHVIKASPLNSVLSSVRHRIGPFS